MSYTHFCTRIKKTRTGGGGGVVYLIAQIDRISWHFELRELLTLGWGVISLDFDILARWRILPLNGFGPMPYYFQSGTI